MTQTVVLIDDKEELLNALAGELKRRLGEEVQIRAWSPKQGDDPRKVFEDLLHEDVRLVVTDYDLTEQGQLGFFGSTVVDWCQTHGIPVGDFSRGNASSLAKEPNLFELRVPMASNDAAADYIATVYRGFADIRGAIERDDTLLKQRSPAAALAAMLNVKDMESQFSQYGIRYGGAGNSLHDLFAETAPEDVKPPPDKKSALLTYIMGHLLVNSVLRFPGPIVDARALAAYLAVDQSNHERYAPLFEPARYGGPFSGLNSYYWTSKVDAVLEAYEPQIAEDTEFESPGERNRRLIEIAVGTELVRCLPPKRCTRCESKNGGFLCPFTDRTVCQRADCSIVSNVWIPAGARLSRIERDFYNEWAPILGM